MLLGKAFFDVDKRPGQDFEVQTPYLAAIVKGTSFSVSVTDQRSRVNVAEGRVGVTALGIGQSVVVGPGQSARVTTQPGSGVSTETLSPGEFESQTPTDGGAPAEGTPGGDGEQRGEGRGASEGGDQAKADNPGRGGENSQERSQRSDKP
ncbi:MAG: FecR domain-containing protein, partial [Rhodospirillaceae bacterium]|nr:FecR domain-containing protein [Rhodospirillaceae bacterium]